MSVALALAALAATAGCGSGDHESAHKAAVANATAASSSDLQGKIVFRRFLDDAHSHGALFVMNANGTGVRQITHPPADAVDSLNGPPGAIPDGSTLVFDRSTPNAAGIFRVGLDGRGELEVPAPTGVPGDGWPVVSPDGARIAVARAWGHQDKFDDLKTGLYVLGIDAGGRPQLVADFGYRADVGGATWSPDGKTIVFSAHNNGPGKPAEGSALFAVGADGRGPAQADFVGDGSADQRAGLLPRWQDDPVPAEAGRAGLRWGLLDGAKRRQLRGGASRTSGLATQRQARRGRPMVR